MPCAPEAASEVLLLERLNPQRHRVCARRHDLDTVRKERVSESGDGLPASDLPRQVERLDGRLERLEPLERLARPDSEGLATGVGTRFQTRGGIFDDEDFGRVERSARQLAGFCSSLVAGSAFASTGSQDHATTLRTFHALEVRFRVRLAVGDVVRRDEERQVGRRRPDLACLEGRRGVDPRGYRDQIFDSTH